MNHTWRMLMVLSCVVCILAGRAGAGAAAALASGEKALQMLLKMAGSLVMWSGLMEILAASGDVERMGRGIRRCMHRLFPGTTDDEAWAAMGMNMAANILGLGNAATPAGIRAAQLLSRQGESGARALAMLLVINNTCPQLAPTTVMTLRSAAGAANPADIWGPTMAVSAVSTVVGVGLMLLLQRRGGAHG